MDVKEFVKTSIVQIIEGVQEAIDETKGIGRTYVNPGLGHSYFSNPQNISFDIAVTVQDDVSTKGGAGVKIAMFKGGLEAEKATANTAVSRLSFSVPVALPSVKQEQYSAGPKTLNSTYDPFAT